MIWLVALARADELAVGADGIPSRPAVEAPVAGQCDTEIAIVTGRPLPAGLVVDGKVTCGGVLVPTSTLADLLNTETAYDDLRSWTRVELAAWTRDNAWWKAQATKPVPITARPWFNYVLGVGTVLGGAWAIHEVGQSPDPVGSGT